MSRKIIYKGKRWSTAKKVTVDGIKFDSKAESLYYLIIKNLLQTKKIKHFEKQVRFTLPDMDGGKRFSYTCDFVVTKLDGEKVYIELKGRYLPGNKLRYAFWQYFYGLKLTVIFTTGLKKFNIDWLESL